MIYISVGITIILFDSDLQGDMNLSEYSPVQSPLSVRALHFTQDQICRSRVVLRDPQHLLVRGVCR